MTKLTNLNKMVTKNISLPKEMVDWLNERDMSLSKVVQRAIRELMEKEKEKAS